MINCNYYVYIYINPITHLPFYIGKGKGTRFKRHLSKKSSSNREMFKEICQIKNDGYEPIIHIYDKNLTEERALFLETDLIKCFGRRKFERYGILTNIFRDRGNNAGYLHSEEGKELSKAHALKMWKEGKLSKERLNGETAPAAKRYKITFSDSSQIEIVNLKFWCKNNNYSSSSVKKVLAGINKNHKNIIKVENLN